MSTALKHAEVSEREVAFQIKNLNKRYDAKVAECESLLFRIRHMEDLTNMLDPPGTQSSIANIKMAGEGSPFQDMQQNLDSFVDATKIIQSPLSRASQALIAIDSEKLRNLEATNMRLETELGLMSEALQKQQEVQFKDNVEHFVRIQELFNKTQIENKQLRTTNKKLDSKIDAKERLVIHLEGKVTEVMIQKEDIIVKLKSDIVLLRANIENSDKNFETKIQSQNLKFQKEFQSNFSS